jgi:Ca2+-transporting ATPase
MWHHQYSGLKPEEVQVRQQRLGLNQLPQQQGPHPFRIFVSQLTNPFVGVLLLACLVTLFLGDFIDAGIIGLSVLINTVLGFIQEERANHSFEALNKYLTQISTVIRSGQHQLVAAAELVPDDIISLKQGDKVPADAVILLANRASFQEAVLTGESLPVTKDVDQEI